MYYFGWLQKSWRGPNPIVTGLYLSRGVSTASLKVDFKRTKWFGLYQDEDLAKFRRYLNCLLENQVIGRLNRMTGTAA